MIVLLDPDEQIISTGFAGCIPFQNEKVQFFWSKEALNFESNTPTPVIALCCYRGELEELEQRVSYAQQFPNAILLVIIVSGSLRELPAFVSKGVNGFISIHASSEEYAQALEKLTSRQNYYCQEVWDEILKKSENRAQTVYKLTKREDAIVRMILLGYPTAQICTELNLSVHTVQTHRKNSFKKLGVKSVTDLIFLELKEELFHIDLNNYHKQGS